MYIDLKNKKIIVSFSALMLVIKALLVGVVLYIGAPHVEAVLLDGFHREEAYHQKVVQTWDKPEAEMPEW